MSNVTGKEDSSPPKKEHWFFSFICKRTMPILAILIFSGVVVAAYSLKKISTKLIETSALEEARNYTQVLAEFRSLYTDEVVQRARKYGMDITHDYQTNENAIPLPATLTMLLGSRITKTTNGINWRLYSNYPFPWRKDGGPHDEFEEEALVHLKESPQQPFYRVDHSNTGPVLRYAVADVMRPSCVSCHNDHPNTLKSDWAVGDVRGALEFIRPLNVTSSFAKNSIRDATLLTSAIGFLCFTMLALVITRLRQSIAQATGLAKEKSFMNTKLEQQNQVTERTNMALKNEVQERETAEKNLRKALDESETMRCEVEQFNELAVDRELRIIELKREINQLLRDTNNPERYSMKLIDE